MKRRVVCILLRAAALAASMLADMLCRSDEEGDGLPLVPL